jgi:hypothetical protein
MQRLKAEKPTESPEGIDCVLRLIDRLGEEGFTTEHGPEEWDEYGEMIYRRPEKLPLTSGETVFIFTRLPELNERVLRRSAENVVQTYSARSSTQKALSVLQATTVYHCLVTESEQPHNELLSEFVTRSFGATFIPVVMVPAINQVLYPNLDEKIGTIRPRVEYLQYLLGERRDPVNMHKSTTQAFWAALAFVGILVLLIVLSLMF